MGTAKSTLGCLVLVLLVLALSACGNKVTELTGEDIPQNPLEGVDTSKILTTAMPKIP